jgi:hypothetical protein
MHYIHFSDLQSAEDVIFVGKTEEEASIPFAIFLLDNKEFKHDNNTINAAVDLILKEKYSDAVSSLLEFVQDINVHDFKIDDCKSMTAEEARAIVLSRK